MKSNNIIRYVEKRNESGEKDQLQVLFEALNPCQLTRKPLNQ